ncbi:hypothetical protein TVAG_300750 [Trichomonas vaginalis G3]|uniref:Uncharacterized protein n=1 Tax=Trichomonas vaginalis (strain ATCC PRA-98 / G3) TaxID=412133 RepID=A2EP55_TRIV3|nr:hypothetical protein TVAGG3_0154900 [Trichomonas vaginalis G3]EAY05593.1 hypothetical protein TVAG_300750 [Trichomonas vaginalis G3]KAI5547503.1 hypothetical protein TVAGG3_0154900 [Trichomonas vaginalis G3]|eukprot:XP_001317816.1 hypothetical protein [Trichomonas vaginalis G3]
MKINMITPNATLKLCQYFISQTVLDSAIYFILTEPTKIIAENFPGNSLRKGGLSTQHVQFYVHAVNDIIFDSKTSQHLIFFDLQNSNVVFNLITESFIQHLIATDCNITINKEDSDYSALFIFANIKRSNIYTGEGNTAGFIFLNISNSYLYGNYHLFTDLRYSGSYSYIQNLYIKENSFITFAQAQKNSLQIDNFIEGTETNLVFKIRSGSDYYSNFICSKQKDFFKYPSLRFPDADSIKVYEVISHESEQKGNYCIDLKRVDNNRYKEHLKICIPMNGNNCKSGYINTATLEDSYPNESSSVNIFITSNSTKTLDLSECHSDVTIEWIESNSSKLSLDIKGSPFRTLHMIGIDAHFNNDVNSDEVILENSNINSKYIFSTLDMKFDQSSSFLNSDYKVEAYELLNYSPKKINFEDDLIQIDEIEFLNKHTVIINNDLPLDTEINLNSQSPSNAILFNSNPLSIIKIDSNIQLSHEKMKIFPCGIVVFRNASGKIPINFNISSETQFIIQENSNIEFDSIVINDKLILLPEHDIKVPYVEMRQSGKVISGSVRTNNTFIESSNYTNVGDFSSETIEISEYAFAKVSYSPVGKAKIRIIFSSTSIPYIYMNYMGSNKGEIEFSPSEDIDISPNIVDFKVPVLKISNSNCKNWARNFGPNKTNPIIDAICVMEGNFTVFYIIKTPKFATWMKVLIIASALIGMILIVIGSFIIYAKLKRRKELKYLNKIYEEQSLDSSLNEI